MAWVCMMSTCGAALSFSMAKGRGCAASAAMSAAVCRVLFLMLPAPQGMYFSPLPCPNCCSVTVPASAGRASSGCRDTKYRSTPVCTGAAVSCSGGTDAASTALSADDSAARLSTACCPRCSRVCAAGTGAARKAASTSAALRAKMHSAANSTAACKKGTALLCPAGRRQGSLLRMARPPFFIPSASTAAAR